ncbi:hypothetical protein H8356DRAFT_1352461 [Neocallimastix lanati (nom. inval.)]|nr:hypothetical protein H8356DRAFT_1352461 [Neocallimastix sp. JGI-2020a]
MQLGEMQFGEILSVPTINQENATTLSIMLNNIEYKVYQLITLKAIAIYLVILGITKIWSILTKSKVNKDLNAGHSFCPNSIFKIVYRSRSSNGKLDRTFSFDIPTSILHPEKNFVVSLSSNSDLSNAILC